MKLRRILAVTLTAAMLAMSLTGCGGGESDSQTENGSMEADNQSGEPAAADDGELYEIVMVIPTVGAEPAGLVDVENALNEVVGPELGVKVTLSPIYAMDLVSQQSLMITSGDKIDLASVLFTGLASYVNTGSFLELDDLYEKYGSDIASVEGVAVSGGYYNGKLYAIPSEEKMARSYGFFARKDIVEELGLSFEENKVYTLDDLEELFAAYKAKYGDGYYCVSGTSPTTELIANFQEIDILGGDISYGVLTGGGLDGNATVENLYASDDYQAYAERMYEWAQKGYFSPDASTNTESHNTQMLTGFYLGFFTSTETDMTANVSRDNGYEMIPINLVGPWCQTSMYQSSLWAIPTTCENPEKTFQFLNYLYADNTLDNLLTFGLEGVSYEVVEKGEKDGQMVIRYADGVDASNSPYNMPLHVFGDKTTVAVFEPMTLDYYTMCEEFNNSIPDSRKSLTLGYVFDSTPVATQASAVSAVVQQYVGIIATGAQDPATVLPQFLEALDAAGVDEVVAENQKQLDAWLAEQ